MSGDKLADQKIGRAARPSPVIFKGGSLVGVVRRGAEVTLSIKCDNGADEAAKLYAHLVECMNKGNVTLEWDK